MKERHLFDILHDRKPLVLPPTTTVQEACRRMKEQARGAVVVSDAKGQLLGIFTGRDAVGRVLAAGRDPVTTKLSEVMTPKPDTVPPGKSAMDALRQMTDGGYRHLPVIDQGKLIGVVSRGDFRSIEEARLDQETGLWERL